MVVMVVLYGLVPGKNKSCLTVLVSINCMLRHCASVWGNNL